MCLKHRNKARDPSTLTDKYVLLRGRPYIHNADPTRGPCARARRPRNGCPARMCGRFVRFGASVKASGEAKFPKMKNSLPWTSMNRRAKFDVASFILGGEIHNRTNNKQTNKQTKLQTVPVTDISTPCLSACVDN